MSQRRQRPHRKPRGSQATGPKIRYPQRAAVDALLLSMARMRSSELARTPSLAADTVTLWALAGMEHDGGLHDVGVATIDTRVGEGSPVLDAATQLTQRVPGRVWGYGLAYSAHAEFWSVTDGIPEDAVHAAQAGELKERATAEEVSAATIFEAGGRAYSVALYQHAPELEPVCWQEHTVRNPFIVDEWVRRFQAGYLTAHTWAAALALDPDRHQRIVKRLLASALNSGPR